MFCSIGGGSVAVAVYDDRLQVTSSAKLRRVIGALEVLDGSQG